MEDKCILLYLETPHDQGDTGERVKEMVSLVRTRGGEVIETFRQARDNPDPAIYFGKGKVEEISMFLENFPDVVNVVVDGFLTPVQQRNLESEFERTVIDREELILEIFALHAMTREAKLQVELAELEYLLPRLRNLWPHLTGQQGGFNFRGPGETQLETDRRAITRRIAMLKDKLRHIERVRATQRKGRSGTYKVSIVGYTNAGKSSLLSELSGKGLYVEDKLFATLDTATKKVYIEDCGTVLFSDTVGFIRNLPHHLVASFKSTLEELKYADLVMEVVDVSSPVFSKNMEVVTEVLHELGAGDRPRFTVFNKTDLLEADTLEKLKTKFAGDDNTVLISVKEKSGIETLKRLIGEKVRGAADGPY